MQHWSWRVIHRVYNVSIELPIELSIVSLAVNDIGAIMSVTRIEWSTAAKWFDAFPVLILEWHIYSQDDTVYLKLAMLNSGSYLNRLTPRLSYILKFIESLYFFQKIIDISM